MCTKRKYPVERMDVSINMEKTGERLKELIKDNGYTVKEIMTITGITAEQTIYKWFKGRSLPSLETQIVLARLFDMHITELLVLDGEFPFMFTRTTEQKSIIASNHIGEAADKEFFRNIKYTFIRNKQFHREYSIRRWEMLQYSESRVLAVKV